MAIPTLEYLAFPANPEIVCCLCSLPCTTRSVLLTRNGQNAAPVCGACISCLSRAGTEDQTYRPAHKATMEDARVDIRDVWEADRVLYRLLTSHKIPLTLTNAFGLVVLAVNGLRVIGLPEHGIAECVASLMEHTFPDFSALDRDKAGDH